MVKVINKFLIVCSLILSVGSVFGMKKSHRSINGIQNSTPVPGNTGLPVNVSGVGNQPLRSDSTTVNTAFKKMIQVTGEDQDEIKQDEVSFGEGFRVARLLGVCFFSFMRIHHYMTKICQVTERQAFLNDSLKFNSGCLLAAGGLALLDYCMPERTGSILFGALSIDMLNCWIDGKTIKPVVEAAASTVSSATNMFPQ